MNTEPTPTSPKRISEFEKDRLRSTKFFSLFIISLIVGLLSGFFGFLLGYKFIYNEGQDVIRETVITESSVSEEASAVSEAVSRIKPSIFHVTNTEGELLGNAVVVTSDGWLVTNVPTTDSSVIKDIEGKEYKIKNKYFDKYSNTDFIKISADNLRPAVFVNSEQVSLGENTLLYQNYPGFGEQLYKDDLVNIRAFVDEENSTGNYPYRLILGRDYPLQFNGGPVVNYQGEVIGLLESGNVILPARAFTTIFDKVISEEKVVRPGLLITYSNISRGLIKSEEERGVYISSSSIPEIRKGDTIMYVNNISTDTDREFNDIILDFQPEEDLEALIIRNGEQQTIKFKL
ncbi:S1C family serine protease [Patescibacteria group bacterium]|nr:S1C family serine protease [Patescibacteria group bacterium]MBU1673417.1 S1C family serine protease [Patescibacteria group bacterium]MBU1963321.1 S1C family serine protease [Patescibacteria group bacterium]